MTQFIWNSKTRLKWTKKTQ